MKHQPDSLSHRMRRVLLSSGITSIAAVSAGVATVLSAALALPVWAMFIGWVAFYTRGVSARDGAINVICVVLGITVGMAATLALGVVGPSLGALALPSVVFVVAVVVVSLRAAPVVNNGLCYFLGLIAFFASHLQPSLLAVMELGSASALGSLAGWIAHYLQRRMSHAA